MNSLISYSFGSTVAGDFSVGVLLKKGFEVFSNGVIKHEGYLYVLGMVTFERKKF